ncbi:acyl-CoA dehydrogenase family protein [Segnochrobactraceae bacterium EtOH-i3]
MTARVAQIVTPHAEEAILPPPPAPLSADFLDRVRDGASRRDAERILPFELVDELKRLRFGARRLAVAHGGAGASLTEGFAAAIDLAEADPNLAHIWRNHHMLIERLVVHETRHPFLLRLRERVAAGDLIGLAATELDRAQTGGPSSFSTTLRPQGGGHVLTGRKFYSTGSIFADWILVSASREDGTNVSVIVPRGRDGVEIIDDWDGMGQRLTGTGTTILHGASVSADEVITPDAVLPHSAVLSSTIAQLFLTSVVAGIIAAIARDAETLLASRRRTFYFAPTEQAKDDPILLAGLGERQADAFAARAVVLSAGSALDAAAAAVAAQTADVASVVEQAAAAAAKAKIVVDRLAHAAGSALYDVAGASSTLKPKNLDRHWRNLRTVTSHNPASYKAFALGNLALNGAPLPTLGFF